VAKPMHGIGAIVIVCFMAAWPICRSAHSVSGAAQVHEGGVLANSTDCFPSCGAPRTPDFWAPCADEFSVEDAWLAHNLKGKMIRGVLNLLARGDPLIYVDSFRHSGDLQVDMSSTNSKDTPVHDENDVLWNISTHGWARPPIVTLPPHRVCNFEKALQADSGRTVFALLTPGNDGHGCPFRRQANRPDETPSCATRLLDHPRVVRYFTSQIRGEKLHPKMAFVPLGFGHTDNTSPHPVIKPQPGNGHSPWFVLMNELPQLLNRMEDGGFNSRVQRVLFICNNDMYARKRTMEIIVSGIPNARNWFPLPFATFVNAAAHSVFSISPEGTAPDGWRHYEFLLSATAVNVPDTPSMRMMLEHSGMPVWFGGYCARQTSQPANCTNTMSCNLLRKMVRELSKRDVFNYDALTMPYWVDFMRRTAAAAASHTG
jgi:hypothetical protein